ncbi:hypothetical protein M0Q50_06440, partial [bacterium]|nr:hypothetical protein [bacterium]
MFNLDYINGNKFFNIANFSYDLDHINLELSLLKNNAIIYCKTDGLPSIFNYIKYSGYKYILITHMSDYPINEYRFKLKPNCIKKWFAENAVYNHPDLISIPIGLENHEGSSKGIFTNHKWFEENIEYLRNNSKDNKIYCNWNINNNPSRSNIIPILQKNNLEFIFENRLSFEDYCIHMSHHKYVICPPGNGIDTHRLWEALYMKCIPIVLKHRIYENYNLPIIQVNKWE